MPRKILPDNLKLGALTAALLVACSGLPALADPPADEKPLEGSFDQPLGKDEQGSAGQSKTVMSTSDGDNSYKVEMSGNKIKAWHNDKPIAKDRIRKSKDKVELLDSDGKVMQTFELGGFPTGGLPRFGGGSGGSGSGGGADQNGRFFLRVPGGGGGAGGPDTPPQGVVVQNAPPVMVGITMSDADEDMLSDLSDDDFESGIVIDRVVEGLPADKAGIKPHDIIVGIGGKPATQETLRDVLSDSKAGDELVIKVLRDRKVSERKVRLEKFDPSKLGMAGQAGGDEGEGHGQGHIEMHNLPDVLKMYGEGGKAQWEEARKAIEKAMRELEQNENLKPEKIRGQAQKALEQAMKALADAEKQGQMQWKSFMGGGEGGTPRTWMWSDKPGQLYAVPQPPSTPRGEGGGGDTSRKLDRLSEQLDRLNRRLDELERRLDSRPRERNP